jgi:hypothetical protein
MERFLPRLAGEVVTPDLIRGSRRGQMMLAPSTMCRGEELPYAALLAVPFLCKARGMGEGIFDRGLAPNPDRSHLCMYMLESQLQ